MGDNFPPVIITNNITSTQMLALPHFIPELRLLEVKRKYSHSCQLLLSETLGRWEMVGVGGVTMTTRASALPVPEPSEARPEAVASPALPS